MNTLLNAKVTPKVVIYLCDWESFKFLFTTTMKSTFITKMWFEFGQYMVGVGKVEVFLPSFMKKLVFYYVYIFSKGSRSQCRLIFWGARNSCQSLRMECPLLLRIGNFIEIRSTSKPLQNIWSPLCVTTWFALAFSKEAL